MQRHPLTPLRAVALGIALWLAVALGWSAFLLTQAHQRFIEQSVASRAEHLAKVLADTPSPSDRQALLDQSLVLDPQIAYAMLWSEQGLVLLHTNHALTGTFLNETQWPALDAQQPLRVTSFSTPVNGSATPSTVIEATVPLPAAGAAGVAGAKNPRTYLGLAVYRDPVTAQFWQATAGLLSFILAFTLAGAVLLSAGILLTFRRLEKSRREIEQNARARTSLLTERGMLASVLAHEVRSPLTALRFNLHSLRSLLPAKPADDKESGLEMPDDETRGQVTREIELTHRCEREIHRLDGMLNDFLLRTQIVNAPEGPGGDGRGTSINTVVREAIDFLAPALERKNIHVSLHLDPADPHVHVHPDELRQVILNLAANAQDAMPPPKGGTLAISTLAPAAAQLAKPGTPSAPAAPDSPVTMLIRDSGTGIPKELHERIFEPFFSTKPNGSGLGLALVRRVISGAGGTVFCESASTPANAPGSQGTTFRILLPPAGAGPNSGG